jgi:hypothetical protein
MIEAVRISETSVFCETTRRYIPEGWRLGVPPYGIQHIQFTTNYYFVYLNEKQLN